MSSGSSVTLGDNSNEPSAKRRKVNVTENYDPYIVLLQVHGKTIAQVPGVIFNANLPRSWSADIQSRRKEVDTIQDLGLQIETFDCDTTAEVVTVIAHWMHNNDAEDALLAARSSHWDGLFFQVYEYCAEVFSGSMHDSLIDHFIVHLSEIEGLGESETWLEDAYKCYYHSKYHGSEMYALFASLFLHYGTGYIQNLDNLMMPLREEIKDICLKHLMLYHSVGGSYFPEDPFKTTTDERDDYHRC